MQDYSSALGNAVLINTCGGSERDESSVRHMQNAHAPSRGPCSDTRNCSRSAEWSPTQSHPCFTHSLEGRQATGGVSSLAQEKV